MKKLFFLFFILMCLTARGQMDIELQKLANSKNGTPTHRLAKKSQHTDTGDAVVVLAQIKGGGELPVQDLEDLGVKIRSDYGRVAVLSVPVSELKTVAALEEIEYLGTDHRMRLMNDSARHDTQVDSLQNAALYEQMGLNTIYDGSGVLVGVVDCGIDFNHAAFRDADGNTRIKMAQIYDTREGEQPADINAVRQTFTSPEEIDLLESDGGPMSHGSHTACTAAGSPVALTDGLVIQGMAPGAELLLSSMLSLGGETYESYCMDAIFCQMEYAKKVGKPIVINNSYGETTIFCDNKMPFNTFCESVTGPGRVLCFASGNSNNKYGCLEYTPKSDHDTVSTVIFDFSFYREETNVITIVNEDSSQVDIKLGAIDFMMGEFYPFKFLLLPDSTILTEDNLIYCAMDSLHDNRFVANVLLPKGRLEGEYSLITLSVVGKKGKNFRIISSGPYLADYSIPGFVSGSGVNSYGYYCESDSVISVGSFCSRTQGNYLGGGVVTSSVPHHYPSSFSSYGWTIDDKPIPDVLAPGEYVLSALNAYDESYIDQETHENITNNIYGYSEQFGRRSYYGWMRGTSMACPSATGIIALWLQAQPNLATNELRVIFRDTSWMNEEVSSIYPAVALGSGWIQAANGLRYIQNHYLPTGIGAPSASSGTFGSTDSGGYGSADSGTYNLNGVRVNDSYRGIAIHNGKKYILPMATGK